MKLFLVKILLLLVFCIGTSFAQVLQTSESIPMDPNLKIGKLENGFTYYIRKNSAHKNQIVMYFVVKAGFLQEEQDQLGLSHLLEHMAFEGTTHFENLYDYFSKHGIIQGRDLNGFTSMNNTIYKLVIPSGNPSLTSDAIQVLRDWAHELLLAPEKIDQERSVVLEEARRSDGFRKRMREQYTHRLFGNSRYSKRVELFPQSEDNIEQFKHASLIDFYEDWYRPELQAAIIVGDINVESIENQIQSLFSDLTNPKHSKKREDISFFSPSKNQVIVVTDKEQPWIQVQIFIKQKPLDFSTVNDYKILIASDLYNYMMEKRVSNLLSQYNPPFLKGANYYSMGGLPGGIHGLGSLITVGSYGKMESGFKAIMTELERVKRFGFTESEFKEAKEYKIASIKPRPSIYIDSDHYAKNLINHFVEGITVPNPKFKVELINQLIMDIDLADVNEIAQKWIGDKNRDILIMAPENISESLPNERTVLKWIEDVSLTEIQPYKNVETDLPSLGQIGDFAGLPDRAPIDSTNLKDINVRTFILPNGIKVILRPFDVKGEGSKEKILIHGFGPGGALVNSYDYYTTISAPNIVKESGVGAFDKFELERSLSNREVSISPYIDDYWHGIKGSSTLNDFEISMQLLLLYLESPRKAPNAFEYWKSKEMNFGNHADLLINVVKDSLRHFIEGKGTPNFQDRIQKLDLEKTYHIYQHYFKPIKDFTFIFSGAFDSNALMPLISKYIGSIDHLQTGDNIALDNQKTTIKGEKKVFYQGLADKASVALAFSGEYDFNLTNNLKLEVLRNILKSVLMERLREVENGTYGVTVSLNYSKKPIDRFSFIIGFECAPSNFEMLISSVEEEVEVLKTIGPSKPLFDDATAFQKQVFEANFQRKRFWMDYLTQQSQNNEPFDDILTYQEILENITQQDIKEFAKKCFSKENFFRFTLLPETYENK